MVYIIYNLSPAAHAEVDIDIRHAHPLRIQEAFEVKVVFDRIDIGDAEAIGDQASRSAAPSWPDGDAPALGVSDKISHNEEIVHKAHIPDHIQFIVQLGADFRCGRRPEPPFKALRAKLFQISEAVRPALRQRKARQVVMTEGEIKAASFRNGRRIVRGFRIIREQPAHLRLAFQVKLLGLKPHTLRVVHGFSRLYAHEHVLIIGVLFVYIMCIVGDDHRNARLPMDAQQAQIGLLLSRDAMLLKLKIKILRPENIRQLQSLGLGALVIMGQDHLGNRSRYAARKTNQPPGMLPQQGPVNTGLNIKSLGETG